jgi:hypothetical protein
MNINGLNGSIVSTLTPNVGATNPSPGGVDSASSSTGGAATTTISTPGQFFSEMQQLSQQNPTEFKSVAAQIAAAFQAAASQATGPQAQFLSRLAAQFTQAAQTGSLQPPQGAQAAPAASSAGPTGSGGAHHHHHHGGGSSAGSAQSSTAQSSTVEQAFQNAIAILTQSLQGTSSTSAASTSSSAT